MAVARLRLGLTGASCSRRDRMWTMGQGAVGAGDVYQRGPSAFSSDCWSTAAAVARRRSPTRVRDEGLLGGY